MKPITQINREPIHIKADNENYEALKHDKIHKGQSYFQKSLSFPAGTTVAVQWQDD